MTTYLVRKVYENIELAKFEDSAEPLAVYTIDSRRCSCPSRVYTCKHRVIAKSWAAQGSIPGMVLDNEGKNLNILPVQD
jgi:hypothetical protein